MKESFYFSHDYNARNDQKILMLRSKYGHAGYSLYFMLLETMAEEEKGIINREAIGGLSVGYNYPIKELEEFIEYCIKINLFIDSEKGFYSQRMVDHKIHRKLLSDKGKEGAEKRWRNGVAIRGANATPMANKGKERKEKERIEKEETHKEEEFGNEKKELHPLQNFIHENCPFLLKVKVQLSNKACEQLQKDYYLNIPELEEVLEAMNNFKDIEKKYNTINLTLRNWLTRRDVFPVNETYKSYLSFCKNNKRSEYEQWLKSRMRTEEANELLEKYYLKSNKQA